MKKYYSIGEFARMLGVSSQTLRNWEDEGKLKPHHKTENGYRYYTKEQLVQYKKDMGGVEDMSNFNYYEMNLTNHLANHETREEFFKIDKLDSLSDELKLHKHNIITLMDYEKNTDTDIDIDILAINIAHGISKQCEIVYVNLTKPNVKVEDMLVTNYNARYDEDFNELDEENRKKYFLLSKTRKKMYVLNECNIDKILEFARQRNEDTKDTVAVFIDDINRVTDYEDFNGIVRKLREYATENNVLIFNMLRYHDVINELEYNSYKGEDYDRYINDIGEKLKNDEELSDEEEQDLEEYEMNEKKFYDNQHNRIDTEIFSLQKYSDVIIYTRRLYKTSYIKIKKNTNNKTSKIKVIFNSNKCLVTEFKQGENGFLF